MPTTAMKNYPAGIPVLTDESETELHFEATRSWHVYATKEEGERWKHRPGQVGWVIVAGRTPSGKPSSMIINHAKVEWEWRSHPKWSSHAFGRWEVTAVLDGMKINQDGSIGYSRRVYTLSLSQLEAIADQFPADLYAWLVAHMKPTTQLKVEEVETR